MIVDPQTSASTETPEHPYTSATAPRDSEVQSATDNALMAVAGYLRLCGIQHPDVLRDQSHRILAMAIERGDEARTNETLVSDALSVAIEEMQRIHDQVAFHSIGCQGVIDRDVVNQRCVLALSQVMKDPVLLRDGESQQDRSRAYGQRHAVTVLPKRNDRPMRHNGTPQLMPVLRPQWWVTMVNRRFEQLALTLQAIVSPSRPSGESPTISE
ncbi:hypothetical protein [Rhodopirellula sp. MGV]|uniref:hypothetical protein n=1 Tax=Rhodopirellula sp. MGV TaxID=2023130 RepID=UPI000B9710B4|nr:hypothetical protein [Rhodopirellula sp. MGV]OYP33926.1 hypothetical protein CGZ80_17225 [Rhodopirellula sp. MGV]PNY34092.1 hypothetical protein C2E31_25165 [Rhodopirellula baltica]